MPQNPLVYLLGIVLAASLLPGGQARAQTTDPQRVAAVKAGMIVNFVRYTTWPDTAFEKDDSPIILTIVGKSDTDAALQEAARDLVIGGRPVELRRLTYPAPAEDQAEPSAEDLASFHESLRATHAVFFGISERDRLDASLEALKGSNVLTISGIDGFAEKGGMLGLAIRDRRITFDANEGAIKETEVQVSSQVMKLARIVETASEEDEEAAE